MVYGNNVDVSGCGNENITFLNNIFDWFNFKAFHRCLKGADGINFRYDNSGAKTSHGLSTAFAYIAITKHYYNFAGYHYVCGSFDTVSQRFTTSIKVVKFGFCNGIINVKRRNKKFSFFFHLIESVNTGCCFFRYTLPYCIKFFPDAGFFFKQSF
ncbi:MAG: hypothetical protein ACD_79C00848G0001 [uncultured bacterium]|nr:MAG: hypothetical protein ACD_79C00848G0001 [uncultured bacterium]